MNAEELPRAGGFCYRRRMAQRFDIVVVGGGPAGSAAAMAARRAGLSVALVDKAAFPRDKLCGGLFTARAAKAMAQGFGLAPDHRFLDCCSVELRMGGQASRAHSPHPIWLTMRRDLDQMLVVAAQEAGVRLITGQPLAEVDLAARQVVLRDGTRLGFGFLVGADGVNSAVRRAVWGQDRLPRLAFALEAEVDRAAVAEPDVIRIDFDALPWGYGWAFPKARSVTVGVGGLQSRTPDMRPVMARYLAQVAGDVRPRIKGHFLPFGGTMADPVRGPVGLAGDAAGLVDPVTGEGIAHALHSGRLMGAYGAARLTADAEGARAALADLARQRRDLRLARLVQALVFAGVVPRGLRQRLLASPARQARFFDLLAGETDYSGLLTRRLRRLWPFGGQ